jgi:chromosome partitioning protein
MDFAPGITKRPGDEAAASSDTLNTGELVPRVIAIANQKGGVGKTTTAVNLAASLAVAERRTLLIDGDPQGNATSGTGIERTTFERTTYDVLIGAASLSEARIRGVQFEHLDVVPATPDLAGAEVELVDTPDRERRMRSAIAEVREDYDFILIDTPPSLGLLTINALTAANKVIVPVQCEYLSMRGLIQLQNTLHMIRENLNPEVEIEGILPTLVDTRTLHAKEAIEILEENFGDRVFASRIRKTVRFAEAPVKGMSVLKYDPAGKAAQAYRDLAKEVLANGNR